MKKLLFVLLSICFLHSYMVFPQETGTNLAYPEEIAYVAREGIALASEPEHWLEGPFNRNILIESNLVDHTCISNESREKTEAMGAIFVNVQSGYIRDMSIDFTGRHMIKDITIRNNRISNSGGPGISINSAKGFIIANNNITNPVMLQPVNNTNHYGIYIG